MTGRRKSTIVGQFVPHRIDLIESPAWRVLSLSARRVLDRIEIEMCHHGGHRENGRLPVTFDDFVRHGVRRNSVASAIREAVALGLVVVSEQGRGGNAEFRSPNKYRLTYICTKAANPAAKYPEPPTDDWKRIEMMDAAEHIAKMARDARNRPSKSTPAERKLATSKKQKSTPQNGTASPPISGVENLTYPPPISGGTGSVTKRGVLSISPEGASASCTLRPSFLGPPARGNLTPAFATPDDATAWFTRLELRQHQPGNAVVLAFPPMTGSTTEEEKTRSRFDKAASTRCLRTQPHARRPPPERSALTEDPVAHAARLERQRAEAERR
jgi:hypothetical protein